MATIVALYTGRIETRAMAGREAATAIGKTAVQGAVRLGTLGLEGDQQADTKNHGGPDRAVCVYADERYEYWQQRLGRALPAPAFGENARVAGRLEDDVVLGEVWQVGEVRMQVTEPRVPCWLPAAHNGEPELTVRMSQTGYTGYLLRVLVEGALEPGAAIEVVERPARPLTIMELNRVYFRDRDDVEGLRSALTCDGLLPEWRALLEDRLRRAVGGPLQSR